MACENKYAREEIEYSLHFALLYQYARQKVAARHFIEYSHNIISV